MTDKVNPSINRPANPFKTAGAIAYSTRRGWISSAAETSPITVQDPNLDETVMNEFTATSTASSLTVDIDPGEAFIFGSWMAIDTVTSVTLAASTTNQTVYLGWNKDGSDDVVIGLQSAFDNATGNTDQKIPLYDFDTDGSGVTNTTDRRQVGPYDSGKEFDGDLTVTGAMFMDKSTGNLDISGELTENTSI